jgi:hypothetical protein
MRRSVAAVVAAGLSAITIVGCSLAGSSAPSTAPTAADAALVDEGVEASLESSIADFLGGVNPPVQSASRVGTTGTAPLLRLAHVPFDLVRSTRMHRVRTGLTSRGGLPPCITFAPTNPVDEDSDGIPDTVSMTAAANCTFTQDSLTFSISGGLTEGDPTPATPDADYMAAANNLVISLSSGANSASIGLNGGATVTETTGSLSQSNQMTLSLASTGTDTVNATYAQNWMAAFSYSGSELLGNGSLPQGTITLTGTTNYTGNGKSFALAISTPTALTYDPTCGTASQLTAGVLQASFNGAKGSAYVTITWSGCQDPTVNFVGGQ